MSRLVPKLLAHFRKFGVKVPGPDEDWIIRRTHAGRNQRACGAWSWSLHRKGEDGTWFEKLGGYAPARLCAMDGAEVCWETSVRAWSIDPPRDVMRDHFRKSINA